MKLTCIKYLLVVWSVTLSAKAFCQPAMDEVALQNDHLKLSWKSTPEGFVLQSIVLNKGGRSQKIQHLSGEYTVLYAPSKPVIREMRDTIITNNGMAGFPEPKYRYIVPLWNESTSSVALNTAGKSIHFLPDKCISQPDGSLKFAFANDLFDISAIWRLDPLYPEDIKVDIAFTAKKKGYFSIATPELISLPVNKFTWAAVPGVLQGTKISKDFIQAYAYANGIPELPVIVRGRTASTLSALLTTNKGVTFAATAAPGTAQDPWEYDKNTRNIWKLGLSVMNRAGHIFPTLYHPVLGQEGSYKQVAGRSGFSFRYTIEQKEWYPVYKHIVNDVYRFDDFLRLKKTKLSLTNRLYQLYDYLVSDSTSMWRTYRYKGREIGAQQYLGGVYGSQKDALKNSDYGAMWMLAKMTGDTVLMKNRIPYAINFKRAQQHTARDFLYGAAAGQYYLYKSKRFTEEWGPYSEPIGTMYYLLIDIGNSLLFSPDHPGLKREFKLAADWLLKTMHPDGHWEVAYDNKTFKPLFTDLQDLRPTFYGMVVAYLVLKEKKYLDAAVKGADWFIEHAVRNGAFLGVCGDARFVPDFATSQSIAALLSLYDITGNATYQKAAIRTAQLYTTSIYTHPVPSDKPKLVNGLKLNDWEIAQAGLGFEHGGILGSANTRGPILLASHAGLFVRLFMQTRDSLLLNMARAAVWGRDAFIDPATGVASYYWLSMNKGAGPYPHHGWWQFGWITDYLVSEALLRSNGDIFFEGSFFTPKVGPHRAYGFTPGRIYTDEVNLMMKKGLFTINNANIDAISAISTDKKTLYLVLLNNSTATQTFSVDVQLKDNCKKVVLLDEQGHTESIHETANALHLSIKPTGLKTLKIQLK